MKLRSFFEDKHGNIIILQSPNIPISLWAATRIVSYFLHASLVKDGLLLVSQSFLFVWAYLEISDGESMFRRVLGGVVLIATILSYF